MTDILFFGEKKRVIAAMNKELPPFKNGKHNSESAPALDRDITSLSSMFNYGQGNF